MPKRLVFLYIVGWLGGVDEMSVGVSGVAVVIVVSVGFFDPLSRCVRKSADPVVSF